MNLNDADKVAHHKTNGQTTHIPQQQQQQQQQQHEQPLPHKMSSDQPEAIQSFAQHSPAGTTSHCNDQEGIHLCQAEKEEYKNEGEQSPSAALVNATSEPVVSVPDGGWGWMIVVGAGINSMIMGITLQTFGIIYLQIRERFDVSATSTVWVGGLFQLLSGLGSPVAAWLVQKYSSRKVTIVGTIINCTGVLATAFAPNLYVVFLTYGVLPGIGSCLLHTASYLLVGTYFEKWKARALALTSVNQGIGALIFAPIVVILHKEYNFSGTFIILSGVFLHSFISAALFRPLSANKNFRNTNTSRKNQHNHNHSSVQAESEATVLKPVNRDHSTEPLFSESQSSYSCSSCPSNPNRTILDSENNHKEDSHLIEIDRKEGIFCGMGNDNDQHSQEGEQHVYEKPQQKQSPPANGSAHGAPTAEPPKKKGFIKMFSTIISLEYLMICLAMFGSLAATATTTQFTPALAIQIGLSMKEAASLVSVLGIFFAIGTLFIGSLLDLPVLRPYRLYFYCICVFITGVSVMALPLGTNFFTMAIPTAWGSASAAVVYTQMVTVLTDLLGRENVPAGFGLLRIAGAFGAITGRAVGGILVDSLGNNGLTFYIFGSLPTGISVILFIVLARWKRRKESAALADRSAQI